MGRRSKIIAALIILALTVTAGSVQAASPERETKVLSLAQCLELAARNNPRLKLAAVALDQAKLGLKETKSGVRKLEDLEKEVEALKGLKPEELANIDPAMLSMSLPADLETSFFKEHGVWAAEQQVALAQASYDLAGEGVRLAVLSAYYDFLHAEANLATAGAAEKEAAEARRAVAAQLKVGLVTTAQDLAAQTGLAGARAGRLGAESAREAKRLALLKEIGLSSDTKITLSPVPEPEAEFELEQTVRAALKSSIDIKVAQFQYDLAAKKFDLTGKWYPDITYKYKGAEYAFLQAQIQLTDTKVAVETGVRTSYNLQLAAKEQLLPAQGAVEQAEADLRAAQAKLKVGAATELDVLTAERALAQAKSSLNGVQKSSALSAASLEAAAKGLTAGLTGASSVPDGGAMSNAGPER